MKSAVVYSFDLERGDLNYSELEPLYRMHYAEMQRRLAKDGMPVADYNPRLDQYFESFAAGHLLNFVIRESDRPVGYSNVWLTNDMHNGELIAQEDTIVVHPDHRNGVGKQLVRVILSHLKNIGVKRVSVTSVTDTRADKLMLRLGFKPKAVQLVYTFGDANVRT